MEQDISILIRELLPIIFALILVKYRRSYGIFSFVFLIAKSYFEFPVWLNIVFWSLTAILACDGNDTTPSQFNHNFNYDATSITTDIENRKTIKEAFKKFDNTQNTK